MSEMGGGPLQEPRPHLGLLACVRLPPARVEVQARATWGDSGNSMGGGGPIGGSGGAAGLQGSTDGGPGGSSGPHGKPAAAAGSTVACIPLAPITRRVWPLNPFTMETRPATSCRWRPAPVGREHPIYAPLPPLASTLAIDATYLFALYQMAGVIATQVAPGAAALAACGAGDTDAACATRFARSFGRRAFRRALDDVEVTDLMKVFAKVCPGPSASCASPADFATAINLIIKVFILAPSFLTGRLGPRSLPPNAAGVDPTPL